MTAPSGHHMQCPKCNAISGDDWTQCGGSCPMEQSPHYQPPADQHALASAEAIDRGMAFLVDGMHVPAERVAIVSVGEGMGPIADMRRATAEAKETMRQLQELQTAYLARATPDRLIPDYQLTAEQLDGLRKLRRWHMLKARAARVHQERCLSQRRFPSADQWKDIASFHLHQVQLLNDFFPVGDNDHLGDL